MSIRRLYQVGLAMLACVAGAVGLTQEQPFGVVPHPDNTTHFDPGVAQAGKNPFFPSRASTDGRKLTAQDFELPELCGGCHVDIYAQWKGSMHSHAWTDPVYRAALNLMSKSSKGKTDKFCMGCHTPIGVVTGEATPSGKGMSEVANRGVQCEVCHNISRTSGIGNGAYVLTPKLHGRSLKFGPNKDAVSPYHDTAYSKLHTQSEFCGDCHDVTHPFNGLPIERTYSEWRNSTYASEGVQCQDCHMKPAPGRSTPISKDRDRIYTHYFVGGNALVTRLLESEEHSRQAEAMLRSAATVKILAPPTLRAGPNLVQVRVTNVGAGHKLPTGFPEGREMWLDFKVVDARNVEVYRLGAVKEGHTEKNTKSFKVVLGDKHGNVVDLNILDADRILYDTRLEPRGVGEVTYVFDVPKGVVGPLKVVADLNYWSFSQALLDELLGKNKLKTHITRMATATASVPLASSSGTAGRLDFPATGGSTRSQTAHRAHLAH
jgi:Cytochrome c554 and c-prime